ncbi:MAG TPA: hypothetical protein VFG15_19060 [Amycolatopsis sp.]|nr:hypothetical protein [Amycolatopsis sp.]
MWRSAGTVLCSIPAAGRDPALIDDAETFDITPATSPSGMAHTILSERHWREWSCASPSPRRPRLVSP